MISRQTPTRDLTGAQRGAFIVLGKSATVGKWTVRCKCGRIFERTSSQLARAAKKNASCIACSKTKHGHGRNSDRTHKSWMAMRWRCLDPNDPSYTRYGGRGIKVCERWLGEDGFQNFLDNMGERPVGKTLDRYPSKDGNYEPGNCRWATAAEQRQNQDKPTLRKLTNAKISAIRMEVAAGDIYRVVAERHGVSISMVGYIVTGQSHADRGDFFLVDDRRTP